MKREGTPDGPLARTDPRSEDPELRGRTYAIAFERVWRSALELAGGGPGDSLPRWTLREADDGEGVLVAEVAGFLRRGRAHRIRVSVGLDEDAQTRVDIEAVSGRRGPDLGSARRLVRAFLWALDDRLAVAPGQVLAPRQDVEDED